MLTSYKLDEKTSEMIFQDEHPIVATPLEIAKASYMNTGNVFVGLDDSLFYVGKNDTEGSSEEHCIWVLARDTSLFKKTPIGSESELIKYWLEGDDSHGYISRPTAIPTTIIVDKKRLVAFSRFKFTMRPSVYFYDINLKKETRKFDGACMLLRVIAPQEGKKSDRESTFYFYADPGLCSQPLNDAEAIQKVWRNGGEQAQSAFYKETHVQNKTKVIKKVVEHHSNTNRNTYVEIDMHAKEQIDLADDKLPDINPNVKKQHTVSFMETSNQPEYRSCWFDRGHNTVS